MQDGIDGFGDEGLKFCAGRSTKVDSQQTKAGLIQERLDVPLFYRGIVKGIEIIDASDLHTGVALIKRFDQMMADESGAAGNEEVHAGAKLQEIIDLD
jgi:hypothetical protein